MGYQKKRIEPLITIEALYYMIHTMNDLFKVGPGQAEPPSIVSYVLDTFIAVLLPYLY